MKQYPIAKPYITQAEHTYVHEVLASGQLSLGAKVPAFEAAFAKKIGTNYACAVSSGTAGLHLAVLAAGIGAGDEVITTPFSFIASANCIAYVRARPVFVDVDPDTYNIDPKKIEAAITKKTKAILVVHIFGQAADMDPITRIAKRHNLVIIEDACESITAQYANSNVGTFGQSAVFAFYPNKQMTTGEGGMLVTDSEEVYDLCVSLRNQGRARDMQWLEHVRLGYNYRMDEMSAAVGLAQLEKLDDMLEQRQRIAQWYTHHVARYGHLLRAPHVARKNTHTWFVYTVAVNKARYRDSIVHDLNKQGIAAKVYLPSIHLFSFYQQTYGYTKGDFPVSEDLSSRLIALPFYIGLHEDDIAYIVETLARIIQTYE